MMRAGKAIGVVSLRRALLAGVAAVVLMAVYSQPVLAVPISYTANLNTGAGNPVTDIMILETDGTQTFLDYSFTLPGSGLSVLTHDVPFTPTKSLVVGLTEGVDDTEIVMFMDPNFAQASVGTKFSAVFPNTRHSELITRLTSAVGGDATELGWFRNTFFPGDGAAAAFNTSGPFTVTEFTVAVIIGTSATAGNWNITNVSHGVESGRPSIIVDETATDSGPFDIQFTHGLPGEYAVAKNVLNDTDDTWTAFKLELGQGVGAQFVPSTSGDGLNFIQALPNREDTGAFPGMVFAEDSLLFTGLLNPDEIAEFVTFVNSSGSTFTVRQTVVPEPTGIAAAVIGLTLLGLRRRAN